MPIIPNLVQLSGDSTAILNAIRKETGGLYQSLVPIADGSTDTLRQIGTVVMGNSDFQNAFLNALINRIGRVIITSKMYENPWSGFKKGLLEYGETVEEIFVNIADPNNFNPDNAENEIFKRAKPDVRAEFHPMNYQKFYKTTVSNEQLRQAFLSNQGITDLVGRVIEALYTSANYDELITMKYLVGKRALSSKLKPIQLPQIDPRSVRDITSTIKGVSNDFTYLSAEFNSSNVSTLSKKDEQYLIMTSRFDAVMDVEVLALSFNMDKAQFMGHRVQIDSFSLNKKEMERLAMLFKDDPNYVPFTTDELTLLKTIPCILVDKDWFMVFDNFNDMTQQYNGEGLYWNYWYHVWKTFSISPFANGVLFNTEESDITSIILSPQRVTLKNGATFKIEAIVKSTGFVDTSVSWKTNSKNPNTKISPDGILTVAKDQNSEFEVVAECNAKPGYTSNCIVTIG